MRDRSNDEAMAEYYQKNPGFALDLLNDILQEGDPAELTVVLRQMANAFGGFQALAQKADLSPKTLSEDGNLTILHLPAILRAMGLRLSIVKASESGEASTGKSVTANLPAPEQEHPRVA